MTKYTQWLGVVTIGACLTHQSVAQVNDYDFHWATVGDINNAAYEGPMPNGLPRPGTGSVGYEYRISKFELSAGQWLEFINTFGPLGDPYEFGRQSEGGGIEADFSYPGPGFRFVLQSGPQAELRPMRRMSWRAAAMYCNWLHNDKAPTVDALLTGAYDTSTWGDAPEGSASEYTDAQRHLQGAKFWIPTHSEWVKAVHYDPDRYGEGQGGYWLYPDSSDTAPIPGASPLLGGSGETNAGYAASGTNDLSFRVGMYPATLTPWGLQDASGGVGEWIEDWLDDPGFETNRLWDGAPLGANSSLSLDRVERASGNRPTAFVTDVGFRIASAIPAPGTMLVAVACMCRVITRRSRAL